MGSSTVTVRVPVPVAVMAPREFLEGYQVELQQQLKARLRGWVRIRVGIRIVRIVQDRLARHELRREGDSVVIDFMDSAPGVSEADRERMFERMFRAETSRNRASGGHGLGLAICQKVVAAHRGHIEARHSPLGGVWMHMRFPRNVDTEHPEETSS